MEKITMKMMRETLIAAKPWNCSEQDIYDCLRKLSDEELEQTDIRRELKFTSLDIVDLLMRLETRSGYPTKFLYHDLAEKSNVTVSDVIAFF